MLFLGLLFYVLEKKTEASGTSGIIFEACREEFLSVRSKKEISRKINVLEEMAKEMDLEIAGKILEKIFGIKEGYMEEYNIREQELAKEEEIHLPF